MSTPISTLSPPRFLRPVSGKIMNDGAAFVPLSPHKGVRNATIIYEAIKNLPDQTLIRGDFDKRSQPLIYFPKRPPKQVGKVVVDAVAARNIRCDRAEFASFMKSIVEATFKAAPPHAPELHAAFELRCRTLEIRNCGRDFTVGDIKEPLRSIAKSYHRKQLKNITSPHRTKQGNESALQAKRFKQFGNISGTLLVQLCSALAEGMGGSKQAEAKALAAVNDMKKMLFDYRALREKENISFSDFLLKYPISRGANSFAKLWLVLNGPDRNDRTQFCTESWALEMDQVCPMIVNEYRAAKRLRDQTVSDETGVQQEKSPDASTPAPDTSLTYGSAVAPANTSLTQRKPRVLRRRFSTQANLLPVVGGSDEALLSPTLKKQSSVPRLHLRPGSDVDRQLKRRDSLTLFQPVVTYRAISTSAIPSGAAAPEPGNADDSKNAVSSTQQEQ